MNNLIWHNEKRKAADLKLWEGNPRQMTTEQAEKLYDSIVKFNLVEIPAIDLDNRIIAGHQRIMVLLALGRGSEEIDVRVPSRKLTEEEYREYNLRSNKNTGEWDWDKLANFDESLLKEIGFKDELDRIFAAQADDEDFDADKAIADVKEPQAKSGDLYQLGEHRLLCGDSTKPEDFIRLMDGRHGRICFTSPPYWLGFEYEQEKNLEQILGHIEAVSANLAKHVKSKIIVNTGNIASITKAQKITGKKQVAFLIDWWRDALNRHHYLLRHIRIWAKSGQMKPSARNDSVNMHWEYIGTFTAEDETAGFIANFVNADEPFQGQNALDKESRGWATSGIWMDIHGNARSNSHVAAFPIILPIRHLMMYTAQNDIVVEPYCGSGTTLIACEQTKRICYGMELNPVYVDVIIARWEKATGKKAVKL